MIVEKKVETENEDDECQNIVETFKDEIHNRFMEIHNEIHALQTDVKRLSERKTEQGKVVRKAP